MKIVPCIPKDKDKIVQFRHNRLTFIAKKLKNEFKVVDTSSVFWCALNLAVAQSTIFGRYLIWQMAKFV